MITCDVDFDNRKTEARNRLGGFRFRGSIRAEFTYPLLTRYLPNRAAFGAI